MTGSALRPLLFLDVDGPLIPFGASRQEYPDGYPTYETGHEVGMATSNPLLARINPEHGPRLMALPCDLVWATTWMHDANDSVSPQIGLPQLPVVIWPEPSNADEQADRDGVHWKTRALVEWAAGRSFAWVDDEITGADRAWVSAHHQGQALLHRVDPRHGLTDADYETLSEWLHQALRTTSPQRGA
ncbi:HAD domain-containing protein [Streptomyces sp. NPDC057136]|uniref:HAD domain-containing protein n=1 Tax=Streptomyces sp. NPDC057136 TaxID=3346029 RepID=UPI00363254B6